VGGGTLFIAMKWRAVIQRSEAAKRAGARQDYGVAPGRSGMFLYILNSLYSAIEQRIGAGADDCLGGGI